MKEQWGGFRSGTDALLLSAYVLRHHTQCTRFVDIGCGDGLGVSVLLQGLLEARSGTESVTSKNDIFSALGIDVQEEALQQAQKRDYGHAQTHFICADICEKKKFRAMIKTMGFENSACAMANPPYYKAGRVSPHKARARALHQNAPVHNAENETSDAVDSSVILQAFCRAARDVLAHHGWFFTIYSAENCLDLFQALQTNGFGVRSMLAIHTRPNKAARWVLVAARKGAATEISIEPSICVYARAKGDAISKAARAFCPWL